MRMYGDNNYHYNFYAIICSFSRSVCMSFDSFFSPCNKRTQSHSTKTSKYIHTDVYVSKYPEATATMIYSEWPEKETTIWFNSNK